MRQEFFLKKKKKKKRGGTLELYGAGEILTSALQDWKRASKWRAWIAIPSLFDMVSFPGEAMNHGQI